MFPVGGVGVMLLGAVLALLPGAALVALLRPRLGWVAAVGIGGFAWSLVVIGLVTLIPAYGAPGIVPAESRLTECSRDIGGPAPEGFWVFTSGQRALNTALFIPSGVLLAVAAARWRSWAPLIVAGGLVVLAAYSGIIEWLQFVVARIDRACDLTDVVDNVSGALIGVVIGTGLALVLRPWRDRPTPLR